MIDKLYGKYFQKSRSFLYPALGIRRDSVFLPNATYICIEGLIKPTDMKLVCSFRKEFNPAFTEFEHTVLLTNPLYMRTIETRDNNLYIFDYSLYRQDWINFIHGKYSLFTPMFKKAIKLFYGEASKEYQHMDTYLNPRDYMYVYAALLNVDVKLLISVGELCDKWDPKQEMLIIPVEVLENLPK
jgi:hypothetical protein